VVLGSAKFPVPAKLFCGAAVRGPFKSVSDACMIVLKGREGEMLNE
jgi:hypothetical protein